MIFEMSPDNFEELLEAYQQEQPDEELSALIESVPKARLTQTLHTHGKRLARVYGSSWERLARYAKQGSIQLFSEDFMESEILSDTQLLFQFAQETIREERPQIPNTLAMKVASFPDVVLMTDRQRIYREMENPDVLNYLVEDSLRVNLFDGTSTVINTEDFPTVWSPSIDTDLYRLALKTVIEGSELTQMQNAAEIGYASGAIARYMVDSIDIENLLLADLNPEARACAESVVGVDDIEYYSGDGIDALEEAVGEGTLFDLLCCNPPYLPRPVSNAQDNAVHFEGTELFTSLITNSHRYLAKGGRLLLNVSNLAIDALEEADRTARDNGIERKLLFTKRVPVKIYEFLTDDNWQNYLRENEQYEREGGYVWQQLMFIEYRKV